MIQEIKAGRQNSINIYAEDKHLRNMIRENEIEIKRLERKLQGHEIMAYVTSLKQTQANYLMLISAEFQNGIQHKLSTIRGKVDELKKKIKEINKETLNYEQEHQEVLDNYSFSIRIVSTYK